MYEKLITTTEGSQRREDILNHLKQSNHKFIVLDDDPTGVQTVHDVYVITSWKKEWIREGLSDDRNVLYILTNTRSYAPERTEKINQEIIRNIVEICKELHIDFSIISRSDSTLRGHYPLEISVIEKTLAEKSNWEIAGHLIIPAFFEGKRYTLDNTHYLFEENTFVPVNETEFANDAVFGFSTANLPKWVAEKTAGVYQAKDVLTISINDIRQGGIDKVRTILLSAKKNRPIVVNAANYDDLDVVSLAVLQAISHGKRFLFRTAASFVKSIGGIENKQFLTASKLVAKSNGGQYGGLLIVGSHTKKTTNQLTDLFSQLHVRSIEVNIEKILNPLKRQGEFRRVCELLRQYILSGEDTVIYTSRKVIKTANKLENLHYSQTISSILVDVVRSLTATPKFIMAKGGITSSDIATKALEIKKAKILGQAAAGVPVLLTGKESRFRGIPYIVFPGNVGNRNTLTDIFTKLLSLTNEKGRSSWQNKK